MALPPPPRDENECEDWLTTYADAITLLMAFFVMLVSFSRIDLEIFDQVRSGLSEQLGTENKEVSKVTQLQSNLRDILLNEGADQAVNMGSDAQGSITLELDGGAFFKPASAELREQAIPVLKSMADELSNPIYSQFNINVEGHTDNDPISSRQFPSNWELSSARASTVVRFFLGDAHDYQPPRAEDAFEPKRFRAIGYADTQPKFANEDQAGNPLPENKAANRRIVLRINRKPVYETIKVPQFRRAREESTSEVGGSK